MGLLDELIILAKEAIDENTGQPKVPSPGSPSGTVSLDDLKERLRQGQSSAQHQAKRQAAASRQGAPTPSAEDIRAAERKHARAAGHAAERVAEAEAAKAKAIAIAHLPAERLGRLLRQPKTMREIILLKELLDKPLCMRRPRY
jgi:hypothetical protein